MFMPKPMPMLQAPSFSTRKAVPTNGLCVPLPGLGQLPTSEAQGKAESLQFWRGSLVPIIQLSRGLMEPEVIPPPSVLTGPETFLSPSIILCCPVLQTPESAASLCKGRQEMRGGGSPKTAGFRGVVIPLALEDHLGPQCLSVGTYAN